VSAQNVAIADGWLQRELRLLLTAVQYFTRIPVPAWVGHSAAQLNGAVRYFPAVGVAVGVVGAAVLWACAFVFPPVIAVLLSTVVTVVVTGAFHEDGLTDTIDGLGGAATRERALEIMKDSRIGTFGALALILIVLLKVSALTALPTLQACAALVAGHGLSRWCAVLLIRTLPYIRADHSTRSKPVVEEVANRDVIIAGLFGLAPCALCGWRALAAMAAALVALGCLARWFRRRLGGITGDTLGATQQISEVMFYLAVLAQLQRL
jgi:adenosylcobinamide-GDP ribazoletransferase